jgi:predicted transcriptional regulator
MEGWIKLHRKILESAVFMKPDYFQVWIYILLEVNHKDKKIIWNNEYKIIEKGSGIFSQKSISKKLNISLSTVNRILKCLENGNQIEVKTTNKYTEIKVVNWQDYQECSENGNQMETKWKPNGKQMETNNNVKNDKNEKNIVAEAKSFVSIYGEKLVDDFLCYWTEKNSRGIERWQMQKTWETSKRLQTWSARSKEFKPERKKGLVL